MYDRIEDFRHSWKEESEDTMKVLSALNDASLSQAVDADHRTLGRLAWHLVETVIELPGELGLQVQGAQRGPVPASAAAIRKAYQAVSDSLLKELESWDDAELQKEDTMFGHLIWKRGYSLQALAMHQAHHRGQMTVLMRQAGLAVPEFYGPTKDGWAKLGMPEPVV